MSTIASPRDPSAPFPRRANSSQALVTPTSSSRPSLDIPASTTSSPSGNNTSTTTTATTTDKRAKRAALREYYNLRANKSLPSTPPPPPTVEITDGDDPANSLNLFNSNNNPATGTATTSSSTLTAELDQPGFDAERYMAQLLEHGSLADLLRTYTRVLAEMRALDAEKKALVYDNYSKLIAATETIRRMRATMDNNNNNNDDNGGGGTMGGAALGVVVERVYELAKAVREGLRAELGERGEAGRPEEEKGEGGDDAKRRTRMLAREVVQVPGRLRRLMDEGREEDARREWEVPRKLLERWREKGLGGEDVVALIEEGDAALVRGEGAGDGGQERERSAVASTTT
ncbi:hypothetical protein N656DRAFT_845907 [Canariomyces notabilis]|uniref:Vacuolar protein sorting-associated protein 51 homolog n=1 Tax=Canariomyces notabilis TaxID=2074819 RepID=A0AAN6YRA5_9PEZI|nr:hypothetical protein N656DRAFT_845907 [Canariomyces arenarius]